jgi:hypothetical protein
MNERRRHERHGSAKACSDALEVDQQFGIFAPVRLCVQTTDRLPPVAPAVR